MISGGVIDEATRHSLNDIQRYLGDEIAPLMAQDAAQKLLSLPAEYGATVVHHWLEAQLSAPDCAVTVSSYLYHAVKKINQFSELRLLDSNAMQLYVAQLSSLLLKSCPERERNELRLRLSRIGESDTKLSAPVRLLNREAGSEEEEERIQQVLDDRATDGTETGAGPKVMISPRVGMMLDRLEAVQATAATSAGEGPSDEVLAGIIGRAAIDSNNSHEFDQSLERLRQLGVEPEFERVLREMGNRLPAWDVDLTQVDGADSKSLGHLLTAMHKIVTLAKTPEEGTERFGNVVYAAIEQFNDGHLAQAVAMFDVAQGLVDENKIDTEVAHLVRQRAEGSVSLSAMRRFASNTSKHGLLRKVLNFFPAFSPKTLLERLDGESKRELRKLMLSLVEVSGPPCRPQLLDRLSRYLAGELPDEQSFYSRNVIFLLRRIPRTSDAEQPQELELLIEYSRPGRPFMVTKEAIGALASITLPKGETVLLKRLDAFEIGAIQETLGYDPDETLEILERTCAALTRLGTPRAFEAVIAHGCRKEPQLGDALGRMEHLGAVNLDNLPDHVAMLLDGLKKRLPTRLLGVAVGRKTQEVSHLIRCLSGTPLPEVRQLFEEIVERYSKHEFAELAATALNTLRAKAVPGSDKPQELHGDLEVFGLPTLLQSIADSELTGRVVFKNASGHEFATLLVRDGKIRHCEVGKLRGLDAICQMFERPQSASFRFTKSDRASASQKEEDLTVMSTILEAVRRQDEFQQDRTLVPDGSSMMPGESKPSLPEDETDTGFVRAVWLQARQGTAPESCEGTLGDAYRVRRLYTHWLEKGALVFRPAA